MTVITRFAPSPTGYLHIGGVRTALFSWLYAKKNNGKFILRIEDTDLTRSSKEYSQCIIDGLNWLGLTCDNEEIYYQSDNFDKYSKIADELLNKNSAYYEVRCIRFKNPSDNDVIFNDLVKGKITISNKELEDFVILRSDKSPTYNLCCIVDDYDMNISHVIRGDDHINNTPKQINILNSLGYKLPEYCHIPMILGNDGTRLSKRHGATNILDYKNNGYLPEAMLNYLVRLGWSHKNKEILSIDEMIELFDIKHIQKSPAKFDPDKLLWLNHHYIKTLDVDIIVKYLKELLQNMNYSYRNDVNLHEIVKLQRNNSKTLLELINNSQYLLQSNIQHNLDMIKEIFENEINIPIFYNISILFNKLNDWNHENIDNEIKKLSIVLNIKYKQIADVLRVSICGVENTPNISKTLEIIGKNIVINRLNLQITK